MKGIEVLEKSIYETYKHKSFLDAYKSYNKSFGVTKKTLEKVLAEKLTEKTVLIEVNYLMNFLDNAEVETIWKLTVEAENEFIQKESSRRLDEYIENSDNVELEKQKMKKRDVRKIFGGRK